MKKVIYVLICLISLSLTVVFAKPNFQFSKYNFNNTGIPTNPVNPPSYINQQVFDERFQSPLKDKPYKPYSKNVQMNSSAIPQNPNQNFNYYQPKDYSAQSLKYSEPVLFIIDFSGSMLDTTLQKKKIDMALNTMRDILPQISPNIPVGLRLYGHKITFTAIDSCLASELVVKIKPNAGTQIYSALQNARPRGNTPITYSLKQAINNDFIGYTGTKRIILLSDGGENCDESPCTYIMELMKLRDDIKIDVIAFDINNQDANNQLKCTALVTSGKFYSANTEIELAKSLLNSLNIEKDVQGVIVKPQE